MLVKNHPPILKSSQATLPMIVEPSFTATVPPTTYLHCNKNGDQLILRGRLPIDYDDNKTQKSTRLWQGHFRRVCSFNTALFDGHNFVANFKYLKMFLNEGGGTMVGQVGSGSRLSLVASSRQAAREPVLAPN